MYYTNKDHKQKQTTTEKYSYGGSVDDYEVVYDDVDDLRKFPEENCGQPTLNFDSKIGIQFLFILNRYLINLRKMKQGYYPI